MGSWSVYCSISNIAITAGQECALVMIKQDDTEYKRYKCATLPIFGKYDDYGGIENIVQDANTALIAEHFGVPIEDFCTFMLEGRLGYDRDEAKAVEAKIQNADETKTWNYMWIDKKVYDEVSAFDYGEQGAGRLEFGNPDVLKLLGFTFVKEDKSLDRYDQVWKYGRKLFYSDGTWLNYGKKGDGHSIFYFNNKYYSLTSYIKLPKEKKCIGTKSMAQLWANFSPKMQKQQLMSILGQNRWHDYGDWEELIAKATARIAGEKYIHKPKISTLTQKYLADIAPYGDLMAAMLTINNNLWCMSKQFMPFQQYVTPQCGDYEGHKQILKIFTAINDSYIQNDED